MNLQDAARSFLQVPYRHQGRNRRGLDCAGLVVASYALLGVTLKDLPAYGREPWKDGLRRAVEDNFGAPLSADEPVLPGDILLFKLLREPQHLAIATEMGMIHSYGKVGRVVETSFCHKWRSRLVGHYRK